MQSFLQDILRYENETRFPDNGYLSQRYIYWQRAIVSYLSTSRSNTILHYCCEQKRLFPLQRCKSFLCQQKSQDESRILRVKNEISKNMRVSGDFSRIFCHLIDDSRWIGHFWVVLGAFHQVMVRFECFWLVLGNFGLFRVFGKYVFTFSGVKGRQRTLGDCNSFWNFTHILSVFKKSSCFDYFHKSPR